MRLLLFNLATDVDDPILGFTSRWIEALAKRVESIHVITMRAGKVEVPANVRVHSVGKERGYSESRRTIEFYRHLFHVLRADKIDACFSHMMPRFTVLAGPILKGKGIPIMTWFAHPGLTWILKLAHHLSDRMVTSMTTTYPYKHDKLTVVGNGIDTDLFSPDGSISREDPPLILCASRLSPVKNHATLLKAAWLVRQRWGKPFRVVVLGGSTGPWDEGYARSLHEQVKELRLEDTVSFESPVSMANLPSWYRRCTVHTNMTPTGSGDKVAWEAMSCGKPCLVANEGFRETLGKYAPSLLFRYGDSEDLANKLSTLFTLSTGARDEMGHYLRQQVVRMHSLERLAGNLIEIFQAMRPHKSQAEQENDARRFLK